MDSDWNQSFLDEDALAYETSDNSDIDNDTIGSKGEGESRPAIQVLHNQSRRDRLGPDIVNKVCKVLDVMKGLGLNLTLFLDAVSWGDSECIANPTIRIARTGLMTSTELPSILRRWWKPPRVQGSSNPRAAAATQVMEEFAQECVSNSIGIEMETMAQIFDSSANDDVTEETLTGTILLDVAAQVKKYGPLVWSILEHLANPAKDRRQPEAARAALRKTHFIILIIISMLSYTRSHKRARLQKLFSIYFKFRGLTAKGFDILHAIAVTMSHKWTCNAVGRISKACTEEMLSLMERFPWMLTYDNLTISFRVFSQRLDNQGEFGNATAATVYIKRSAIPLPESANRDLQEMRSKGMAKPLSSYDILSLADASYPQIHMQKKYEILRILLDAPDFNMPSYEHKDSPLLRPPMPVYALPTGKEHVTLQFLLGTANIPEASYEDNARLIKEWLHQLKFDTPEMRKKLGLEQVIAWVGDQLTVDRLRKLFKFRAEDLNSYDRLDWMVVTFGWFHLLMAVANSFHKQYLGTSRGRGLSHAFDILEKKGLGSIQTKGPFYHDLKETLYTVAAAHLREDWLLVGGEESLSRFQQKTPEQLLAIASRILDEHASSLALEKIDRKPENERDQVKRQTIMWNRDILQYIVLDKAIKHGDVGLMENCLPHLFLRFIGGKSSNYAGEVLELLQCLEREWPPEIKDFVRNHCWLLNTTGRPDGFLPFDQAQEHNNRDIKVNYRSQGPSIDWEYLKKLHPAIHIINAVGVHVEQEFDTLARGKKHTIPKRERDIQLLQQSYRTAELHEYRLGRKVKGKDRAKDITTEGGIILSEGTMIARWVDNRSFERSTDQTWDILSESDNSDND